MEDKNLDNQKHFGLLFGSSHGRLLVSLKDNRAFCAAQRMVEEFGFKLVPVPYNCKLQYKHFEYYQDFRVFCCSDKYGDK